MLKITHIFPKLILLTLTLLLVACNGVPMSGATSLMGAEAAVLPRPIYVPTIPQALDLTLPTTAPLAFQVPKVSLEQAKEAGGNFEPNKDQEPKQCPPKNQFPEGTTSLLDVQGDVATRMFFNKAGDVMGYIQATYDAKLDAIWYYFYVDPKFRGQGLATNMALASEQEWMTRWGKKKIFLSDIHNYSYNCLLAGRQPTVIDGYRYYDAFDQPLVPMPPNAALELLPAEFFESMGSTITYLPNGIFVL